MSCKETKPAMHHYNAMNRAPHSLHECSSPEEFCLRFETATGRSVAQMADEVVATTAPKAVFLVGSLPLGMATQGSDIDIIILVDDQMALLDQSRGITNTDQRLAFSNHSDSLRAGAFLTVVHGVLVDISVVIAPSVTQIYRRLRARGPELSESDIQTLSRLSTGWLLWQSNGYLQKNCLSLTDPALDVYCSTKSFVSALHLFHKSLKAVDFRDSPLALDLGRSSVEAAYLAYFASEGLSYLGPKWLAQLGHARGASQRIRRHPFLLQGIPLLFPHFTSDLDNVAQYLQTEQAVRLLSPDGKMFIGGILHHGLLCTLHAAIQLSKAPAAIDVGQLRKHIARATAQESRLAIHPNFFRMLPGCLPGIGTVAIQLRREPAANELGRFGYDVVLHRGSERAPQRVCEILDWQEVSRSELEVGLRQRRWSALRLEAIPNSCLSSDIAAQHLIEMSDQRTEVGTLRRRLNELPSRGLEPKEFWRWSETLGYDLQVSFGTDPSGSTFDVQLFDRACTGNCRWSIPPPQTISSPIAYANDPLHAILARELIPQLRRHLEEKLPDYMIPSLWVPMSKMPLSQNGKLDRRALPEPQACPNDLREYIAPRTQIERVLADIWNDVLQIDHIGVQDNFFDLGGHSLHAVRVIAKTSEQLCTELSFAEVLQFPTIEQLAGLVKSRQSAASVNSSAADYEEGVI